MVLLNVEPKQVHINDVAKGFPITATLKVEQILKHLLTEGYDQTAAKLGKSLIDALCAANKGQ